MTLTETFKNYVKNECGIPVVGIAGVDDLGEDQIKVLEEMNRKMAGYTPLYSTETPIVQPEDFLENARSIVVVGVNMFFGERDLGGGPVRAEIMNFYVNAECIAYVTGKVEKVTEFLTEQGFRAMTVPNGLPIKLMAARAGLGRYGKNAVIQTPELGSWMGLTLIITDAPLDTDPQAEGDCGECTLCRDACPTGALDTPYTCNIDRCLTLHMVNNKQVVPRDIRDKTGTIISHCNACLYVCPKNRKLEVQSEISTPEDLVYPEIAPLVNMTEAQYQEKYGGTFLEFMFVDKKYLQRNAAIALGNHGDPKHIPVLAEALRSQPEEIVRGHAAWALGKIGTPEAKQVLEGALEKESSEYVREEIDYALGICG